MATFLSLNVVHNWRKKMTFNLKLKYESKIDLKLNPSEFKKQCELIKPETNIIKTSFKKRQLGLMIKHLKFLNNSDFEIIKTGDFLNAFKSGRGIINGHLKEKENNCSILDFVIRPNYNELAFNIFLVLIILINLAFGNPEMKYLITAGMTGVLVLGLAIQILFMRLNINRLRIEFLKFIEMIENNYAQQKI